MNNKDTILEVKKLNTSFLQDHKEVRIIKDISLCIPRGKALAVVGESGCGKSVLMNSILRFLGKNAVVSSEKIAFYKKEADGSVSVQRIDQFKKNLKCARCAAHRFRWCSKIRCPHLTPSTASAIR